MTTGLDARAFYIVSPWVFETQDGKKPCNNGCRNCEFSPEALRAVDWSSLPNGAKVFISGYEPLLSRHLRALVALLRNKGCAFIGLITNGRLCVYDAYLQRTKALGFDMVIVKLFGVSAQEHDAWTRMPGSFAQSIEGIKRLCAEGVNVRIIYGGCLPRSREKESIELAYKLTNSLPFFLRDRDIPLLEVLEKGILSSGLVYDCLLLRGSEVPPRFAPPLLPMVHIPVNMTCNNRCLYCNVKGGESLVERSKEAVFSMIRHASMHFLPKGHATLDLIGGEPTTHPSLVEFVRFGRECGFEKITLCTNGRRLARGTLLDTLISSGLTGIRFSFHDHRESVASFLAGRSGVGKEYIQSAKILLERKDIDLYIYRILLSENLHALSEYIRFLADNRRNHETILRLHLGLPSPRGRMLSNKGLFPDLFAAREEVMRALELAGRLGIDIAIYHGPACLIPREKERHAALYTKTVQVWVDSGRTLECPFEGDTSYAKNCEGCAEKEGCPGVAVHYLNKDPDAVEKWVVPYSRSRFE